MDQTWITHLQESEADLIVVLDYDYLGELEERKNILYLLPPEAKIYMTDCNIKCNTK